MSDNHAPSERRIWLLPVAFILSGTAALVAELSWSRQVGQVLGHTASANALVLMAYFTGLAGGQWLGGLFSQRRPLRAYAFAEVLTGLGAACVPTWLRLAEQLEAPWATVACFASLLPPTLTLGTTLPLIVAYFTHTPNTREQNTLRYYALNTLGGVAGIVLAVSCLLLFVGVRGSNYVAASISIACGLLVCCVAPRSYCPTPITNTKTPLPWCWLAVAGLSGFLTLALQVLYTRLFALVLHNSTYTFAALLAVFLAALACGSWLVTRLRQRTTAARLVLIVSATCPFVLACSVLLFVWLTRFDYLATRTSFAPYLLQVFALVAVVVGPPVVLLGMLFPAALAAGGHSGIAAARLVFVNLVGGVLGAFAAGFILLPHGGLWFAFNLLITLASLPAVVRTLRQRQKMRATVILVCIALLVFVTQYVPEAVLVNATPNEVVLVQWDSSYGRIDVVEARDTGALRLRQNLHYRHGSMHHAVREYRQGRLPLLLHPQPHDVAFVGLGTGLTAAPVVLDRRVVRATIIELIPEVAQAARHFSAANLGVCDDPKTTLVVADARYYFRPTEARFDVVVADLFVPWESHSGYLYTVDFYRNVYQRLKHGGLFCQWLALYQLGPAEFELIADSFASVFPNVSLWWGQLDGRYPIVALCGSATLLALEPSAVAEGFAASKPFPTGTDPELARPSDLGHLYFGEWPKRTGPRNTDEHPRLEFQAPFSQQGRTLSSHALQEYFDRVLSKLPTHELPASWPSARERRTAQRLALFGNDDS